MVGGAGGLWARANAVLSEDMGGEGEVERIALLPGRGLEADVGF